MFIATRFAKNCDDAELWEQQRKRTNELITKGRNNKSLDRIREMASFELGKRHCIIKEKKDVTLRTYTKYVKSYKVRQSSQTKCNRMTVEVTIELTKVKTVRSYK